MTLVTGLVIDSRGDPVPGAILDIAPPRRAAFARPDGLQVPAPVVATADGAGFISFEALPGLMVGEIRDGGRRWPIELRIPDQPTAILAACVEAGGGEIAPASVLAAQNAASVALAARDQTLAAAESGGAGGGIPEVEAVVTTTSAGLAATEDGEKFAVADGVAVDVYANSAGSAALIREGVERTGLAIQNEALAAPALIALAEAEKTKRWPIKKLLGWRHNFGNDASNQLNAMLPDFVAQGFTITDPDQVGFALAAR